MKKSFLKLGIIAMAGLSFFATSCKDDNGETPCVEKMWYKDADGDGKGDPNKSMKSCEKPEGYVDNADDDDDRPDKGGDKEEEVDVVVNDNISKDTKWTADKVYHLNKRIFVLSGATLTIEPGTIIKGEAGNGANATALVVARGGKLMAEGTAEKPIIFTAAADKIMPGEVVSPNMDENMRGFWGGVILLGKAPISVKGDVKEFAIEGIPVTETDALYGGDDENDNSGVLKYVSIRHGGSDLGDGDEINGLSLGGVGNGTVIENIEIVGNNDDGVEWFGGTVNVKNLLVWNNVDDAIDTDQNWKGTLDGFVAIKPGDKALELDGPEGTQTPMPHTIQNGYIKVGKSTKKYIFDFDDNSAAHIMNVKVSISDKFSGEVANRTTAKDGDVTFNNVVVSKMLGDNKPEGITEGDVSGFDFSPYSWTWAAKAEAWK